MLSTTATQEIMRVVNWSDLPRAIAHGFFPIPNTPASKWSLVNRVISVCGGSLDHRGVGQWKAVNRYLQKGCKPIYIVCPQVHHQEDKKIVEGFIDVPVYPVSQTYGDPVQYVKPASRAVDMKTISITWNVSPEGINWKYPVSTCFDETEELAGEGEKQFVWQVCHQVYAEIFQDPNRKDRKLTMELSALAFLYVMGRRVIYCGRHLSMIQQYGQEMRLSSLEHSYP